MIHNMIHNIKLIAVLALISFGAGQAWARGADLGSIKIGTVTGGGTLTFYKEAACQNQIGINNNLSSSDLTDGKVYIKATPSFGYTVANMELTAQESTASDHAEARTFTRSDASGPGVGQTITVSPVSGKPGIYSFTMPTNGNNALVSATFPDKQYLTGVRYIDPTKTGDEQNATTPTGTRVYILDGTETSLDAGWYICNTAATANSGKGLSYTSTLQLNGDVHLILADNAKMSVDANNTAILGQRSNLYIYGQSDDDNSGKLIATNSSGTGITIIGKLYVNGGQVTATGTSGIYCQQGATINGGQLIATGTTGDGIICNSVGSSITISGGQVEATGYNNGIDARNITVSGGQVTATGTNGDGICFTGTGSLTITGGQVEATGSTGFNITGDITVSGGQVTATGTNGNGICCVGSGNVTISGGQVEATGSNNGIETRDITVSGGQVTATGTNGNGCKAQGSVTITGGQVEATGSDTHYGIFDATGDIILGWTNPSDYIKASSYSIPSGKSVKTTEGKRFVAYNMASESDISATAIVSDTYYTRSSDVDTDDKLKAALADINGKTLKPLVGNIVSTTGDISLTDGETAKTPDFTIGETSYYKYSKNASVTLTATDSENKKLSSVTLSDGSAVDVTDNGDNTFTFTMGESDVTVTAATFLEKVSYIDPTATGDDKIKTVFATPLTGNETNLAEGWYVVNKDINFTAVRKDQTISASNIVLSATGNVNLILANGKTMNIGSAEESVSGIAIVFSPSATLTIYGQGGTTEGSLNIYTDNHNPIDQVNGITIYGGNLTANYMLMTAGKFTIHGGTFNNTCTNSMNTAINAAEINICGGTVTSVNRLYGNQSGSGDINISGGVVDVKELQTGKGSIAISGGQVTIGDGGIYSKANLTLSWTDAESDYIASGGTFKSEGGSISIASDKHFFDYDSENAIVAVYDAETLPEHDNDNFYSFNGKTLKPAVKITLPTGVTATGADVFTSATAGTYAKPGAEVSLSGSASEGKTISFTVKDADNNDVTVANNVFTMPATAVTVTATETNIEATAPTITGPSDLENLVWGDTSGNELSVSASAETDHDLSYQWYVNSSSTTDGTAIDGATSASYAVSTEYTGIFYYYCVVTATRTDNSETASAVSDVATVTVSPKEISYDGGTISGTITQDEDGYTVSLDEGIGSANPLPDDEDLVELTYSRTLTAPGTEEGSGDVEIGGMPANLYTVCLPFAPETGTGVKYYTLSGVSGETISFEEVTITPAANTPYLVAVTGSSNLTESCTNEVVTSTDINSTTVGDYTFKGTFTGMTNADAQGRYILQAGNQWGKVTAEKSSAYIPPFRAYIEGPASGARMLTGRFDDDATGLQYIRTTDADGTEQWYDLNGRRISKPTQKGMYIHNGRKEVMK